MSRMRRSAGSLLTRRCCFVLCALASMLIH
jgi:hypothetical protein